MQPANPAGLSPRPELRSTAKADFKGRTCHFRSALSTCAFRKGSGSLVHHNAATQNAAMHNASFSQRYPLPLFLQRHRCDALPCFSASPVVIFYIAHVALRPLLPFFLSPQWFTVQNHKKFAKSHNAAMSPLATRDGHRKRKRKRSDAVH